MRELPRQLSADELAELFEGRTRFVERLAAVEDPLGRARDGLSAKSAAEQGTDEAPELDELNLRYEDRFGFRFVVFVNRRPKAELVPILRERLGRTRERELETALDELVSIAIDRWQRS